MLPIACHANSYRKLPLKEALGTITRLGFQFVDLSIGSHIDGMEAARHPEQTAEAIQELLDDFRLTLTDLYILFPHINDPDPATREEHILEIERLIPFAEALGTPGITISPGLLCEDGEHHSIARSVPALQRIMDLTENTDLRISFKPYLGSATATTEQCLCILEAVPGLNLTLDIAHFVAQETGWRELRQLFEYTAHVQIRQARPHQLQTEYKKGKLEVERFLRELFKSGYHDVLAIEYLDTIEAPEGYTVNEVMISQEIVTMRDILVITRRQLQAEVE